MKYKNLFLLAIVIASFCAVVGCGSSEDTKLPEGTSYYNGEMKPKGGGASDAGSNLKTDTTTK